MDSYAYIELYDCFNTQLIYNRHEIITFLILIIVFNCFIFTSVNFDFEKLMLNVYNQFIAHQII